MSQSNNSRDTGIDPANLTQVRTRPGDADMTLSLRPSREGYISKRADVELFRPADETLVYVDTDRDLLVFDPVDPDGPRAGDPDALTLGREYDAGANISLKSALRLLEIDSDWSLEESRRVPLERRGEYVVADLAELLAEIHDRREGPQIPKTGRGDDPPGNSVAQEAMGEAADVDLQALAGEVRTVQEFAERLDVHPDRGRTIAMNAGVYSDLFDQPQDGAYRGGVRQ